MLSINLQRRTASYDLKLRGELVHLCLIVDYGVIWSTFFLPETTTTGTVLLILAHKKLPSVLQSETCMPIVTDIDFRI